MFKVLYQPELRQRLPSAPVSAFAAIVYDGSRRLRVRIISIAQTEERKREHAEKYETAVRLLNSPSSLSEQKERLRSILAAWRESEAARRRQEFARRQPANFRADFGRMDIGLNPGWGRD